MKWEYVAIQGGRMGTELLNSYGYDGWELVSFYAVSPYAEKAVFKRPLPQTVTLTYSPGSGKIAE